MSASPMARQAWSHAQTIPTRKVLVTDPAQMPEVYSSTPGGTLYSTTPGGTRLIYERAFMMNLKSSPLSQTPPKNIPQCLIRGQPNIPIKKCLATPVAKSPPKSSSPSHNKHNDHDDLFEMEM
ncbi:eukaryotic translation initiation factor 4E-binding protein [Condylostylus longicornis]|uniref:eukaryotic translation initiation factor 4E-binding protein n=1 Tax=Condylostylus longicornis TaxID=2530218 RepID=UPI00244DDE4E|nr:eukaryotic translation initiation factor 4E-binding protein [Condylostylus longicornis]